MGIPARKNRLFLIAAIIFAQLLTSCVSQSDTIPRNSSADEHSLSRTFPELDLKPILLAPAGEPLKRKVESYCPPAVLEHARRPEDLPCIGTTGTSYPTPFQGIALEAYWFVAFDGPDGPAVCKIATLTSRANSIANNAMSTLRGSVVGGGLFSNLGLIQKAASIADNPYKAQQFSSIWGRTRSPATTIRHHDA